MNKTTNQPTSLPTNKVAASVLAGAVVAVALWFAGTDAPDHIVAALTTIVSFLLAWLVPNRVTT